MRDAGRTQHPRAPSSDLPWSQVTRDQFARALAGLPALTRAVFELQAIERQSYERIAAQLHLSRSAVAAHLHRARALLKAALRRPQAGGRRE